MTEEKNINWRRKASSLTRWVDAAQKVAWALFLVCLPVTSFPYFPPAIGGGALVRPLSVYPLIILLLVVVLPRLLTRPFPPTLLLLLPFTFVASLSSLLALLQGSEIVLGISALDRVVRALITLGIGGAIYATVILQPRTPEELRASLRWLYLGLGLALVWGSVQIIYILDYSPAFFKQVNAIQSYISIRRLLNNRISGLTYEPNWFAEQISFLYMPWLMASVLTDQSAFRWRPLAGKVWQRLTVEFFLLGWSIFVLLFTFSRAGLGVMISLALCSLLVFRQHRAHPTQRTRSQKLTWVLRLSEAGAAIGILVGMIYFAGSNSAFFARIWNYWREKNNPSLSNYLEYLGFGARLIYGETALRIYAAHPLWGVGLGNYAFHFDKMLPDQPLAQMPEVLRLVTPEPGRDRLLTSKNLYFRLLAETGLAGTAAFLAFVFAVFGCALYLWRSSNAEHRYWGIAGLLGMVAFAISAFSYDSFAIPNMWVVFGLVTAAAWTYRRSKISPAG